ncbi:hypothetical protein C8J56DRAFT_477881 [Mycena floridula]|nr:hypothetical protein C8J56DRAFT_477881 [Mycena floridula]
MSSSGSSRSGHSSRDEPSGSQSSSSEVPVTSQTYVEGPSDAQNCGFHRFPLSFIQRLGDYEDEFRATKCVSGLLTAAEAFIDASAGEPRSSGSINVQRSKDFQKQMNQYFTAASGAERSQPLADALNTILEEFRDHKFDSLPDSNDLAFSAHPLGVAGMHYDALKRLPNEQVSEANILNLWDITFSRQISPTTVPIISRPEQAISRSRTRSRTALSSNISRLLPRPKTPTSPSSQSTAYSSRKRRLENATSSPPKKRKLSVVPPKLSAQSASYVEKRLAAEPLMNHALGLILEDEQLFFWWHDRESTVQSFPIDMTSELAHVVVVVILFQRFSETDWGSSGLCSEGPNGTTTFKVADRCFSANITCADLRRRGTLAVPVSQSGHDAKFFMKASFRDAALTTEATTIAKCYDLADGDRMILDHLPSVVVAQDFPKSSTPKMRNLLGLASHKPTMLQILVFDWLDPITSLKGEHFWVAFWNILRCHFLLWQRGMQHGDISVNNIRYNPVTQKGVLNDFDLALFIPDQPPPLPRRRATGTMPFMALELLAQSGWTGETRHIYRHDLESFSWVLLWICLRFREGKEERPGPLENFLTNDHEDCFAEKLSQSLAGLTPTQDYAFCWRSAGRMVSHWKAFENAERLKREERSLLEDDTESLDLASAESVEESDVFHLKKMLMLVAGIGIEVELGIPLE